MEVLYVPFLGYFEEAGGDYLLFPAVAALVDVALTDFDFFRSVFLDEDY